MSMVLGIAGFVLVLASTYLSDATLWEIALVGASGLVLMIAGRLWNPAKAILKERRKRREAERTTDRSRENAA